MGTYRILFFDDGIVCGRFVFQADDDDRAVEIATILFDACCDRCQSWGIWKGTEFVSTGPRKFGPRLRASDLAEHRQESVVQCEETILDSEWAIASSMRLLAEIDKFKSSTGMRYAKVSTRQHLP